MKSTVPLSRWFRRYATCVLAGLLISSFVVYIRLFYLSVAICPRSPNFGLGFIYPLSNHGGYYYLNAADAMSMKLASILFLPTLLALIIVVPKVMVIRRMMGCTRGFQVDRYEPTRGESATFWLTVATYLGASFLFGSNIVAFALKSGLSVG